MRKIIYLNILILYLTSCASNESVNSNGGGGGASYEELLYIECTVDGTDRETEEVNDSLNLWSYLHGNAYAGKVGHGERVLAIKRQGDAIFIETRAGTRGWLSYWHLKELKKHFTNPQ